MNENDQKPAGRYHSALPSTIAQQIRSGPLQDLGALWLKLMEIRRRGTVAVDRDLTQIEELTQSVISQLRGIVTDQSRSRRRVDLYAQLQELQDSFLRDSGIPCVLEISAAHTRVDAALADVIYRCIRELLDNVRKHSHATMARIESAVDGRGGMTFTVSDNGIGLPELKWRTLPKEGTGFGLWSIEHRLANYGGVLEIRGDDGVEARVTLPSRHLIGS